jgi:co-chaperonin GroES (HSP10)
MTTPKTTQKLSVGPDGQLEQTTKFKAVDSLPTFKGKPTRGLVFVQQLSNQEIVTKSGIVLPSISSHETRVLVVSVADDVTEYKVGDVVAMSLGHGNPPIYMIEGEPITPVYPSTLIWIYDEKITDYR